MDKEKLEIPMELDAAILQYAAAKKFPKMQWYRSWTFKAAAAVVVLAVLACTQIDWRQPQTVHFSSAEKDEFNWEVFEEKMEYIDEEIFFEAQYLAQL